MFTCRALVRLYARCTFNEVLTLRRTVGYIRPNMIRPSRIRTMKCIYRRAHTHTHTNIRWRGGERCLASQCCLTVCKCFVSLAAVAAVAQSHCTRRMQFFAFGSGHNGCKLHGKYENCVVAEVEPVLDMFETNSVAARWLDTDNYSSLHANVNTLSCY